MRNEVRKKLLADYAVALVAERESWGRLHEPDLTEAQRCRILGEWKQVSAGLKTMARQLRDAPVAAGSPELAQAAQRAGEAETEPGLVPAPPGSPRPFHVQCLQASVRLVTALRARLETAVPRLGSL